jgi:hypothetical protein
MCALRAFSLMGLGRVGTRCATRCEKHVSAIAMITSKAFECSFMIFVVYLSEVDVLANSLLTRLIEKPH